MESKMRMEFTNFADDFEDIGSVIKAVEIDQEKKTAIFTVKKTTGPIILKAVFGEYVQMVQSYYGNTSPVYWNKSPVARDRSWPYEEVVVDAENAGKAINKLLASGITQSDSQKVFLSEVAKRL